MINVGTIIQEPIRRSIQIEGTRYFLSFPQLKFQITTIYNSLNHHFFDNLKVFVRINETDYSIPFLPNFFPGGVCLGLDDVSNKNPQQLYNYIIANFWTSKFTNSLINAQHHKRYLQHLINGQQYPYQHSKEFFNYWQQKTKENPNWIPNAEFFKIKEIVFCDVEQECLSCFCSENPQGCICQFTS
jgi:hypothetical protein